jgi:hypothetical protein
MIGGNRLHGYSPLRGQHSIMNATRFYTIVTLTLVSLAAILWVSFDLTLAVQVKPPHFSLPKSLSKVSKYFREPKWGVAQYWSISGDSILEGVTDFVRPEGLKIVALVFYGRPASVSILDCYLRVSSVLLLTQHTLSLTQSWQRNLVENGGVLDEVVFLARTKNENHLAWLDQLVETSDAYRRHDLQFSSNDFSSAYDICKSGVMYVKIDDDIVRNGTPPNGQHIRSNWARSS